MSSWQSIQDLFVYNRESPMIFNSGEFFVLFTVFLLVYGMVYRYRLVVSLWVIAFSFFFYYKSSGLYFFLLIFAVFKDFYLALLIKHPKYGKYHKWWVLLSVASSLGILGYYKYTNLLLGTFANIVENNFQPLDIFLPIGISFFTFQSISYILDVNSNKVAPTTRILDYAFYLSFFPQLVAGPIVKANHFLPQLQRKINPTRREIYAGFYFIILGLIKKAVIADYIAQYNDIVFANPANYSGFENLMAVYGYTLQIYCDFSGYSDMAIGLGMMMGFDLGVNFRLPYQSKNIAEFWRRWHISLSTWLRDYLYIPLGGNRKGKLRTYINLFITMLLGGLWHGASWKFVFWGGLHGVGLAVHRALKPWLKRIPDNFGVKALTWFITFHFVVFLWIFFRAVDFQTAWDMINQILFQMDVSYFMPFLEARDTFVVLFLIGIAMHAIPLQWNDMLAERFVNTPYWVKLAVFIIAVQLVIQFQTEDVQPFIYFQF